jgi:hypothetical protein
MRQTARFALLAAAASLMLAGGARAQSIYGPGGLFLNPTADFPARGQITPSVLVIPQASGPSALGGKRTWYSYSLDYGVTERIEIGVTHLKVAPGGTGFKDGSTGGSVKYKLVEGRPGNRPDVAIGAGFLTGGDVNASVQFVALRFTPKGMAKHPMHLHLGAFYANVLNQFQRRNLVPYAGVDYQLSDSLILFGEMRARSTRPEAAADVKPPSAIGLVWQPSSAIKVALAYANNGWSDSHKLAFGVGYRIGIRR